MKNTFKLKKYIHAHYNKVNPHFGKCLNKFQQDNKPQSIFVRVTNEPRCLAVWQQAPARDQSLGGLLSDAEMDITGLRRK